MFTSTARLDVLARVIENEGGDVTANSLLELAEAARAADVSPVLVDVLVDPAAPVSARVRAYGKVSACVLVRTDRSFGAMLDRASVTLAA